jgi:FAD binding domain
LLKSLLDREVDLVLETEVQSLLTDAGRVTGLVARQRDITRTLLAKHGVVLAAGGFNHHPDKRKQLLQSPVTDYSPAAPGHSGGMQDLALEIGAHFADAGAASVFWAPVSVKKRSDGSTAVFPHFVMDRSKPGTVCVNQKGERFTNESQSYHLFVKAMLEAHKTTPTVPAFILTDAKGLLKYGLGMVRMGTKNPHSFIDEGYLLKGDSIDELAYQMGADPKVLAQTLADMNRFAESGVDEQFGRGATAYHRANGDPTHGGPNPCLGPIQTAPFYAVKLYPGDIGAASGLAINADAQVLREGGPAIEGLYACGNEAQSMAGGTYPGPGITIGPAITFAYRAIRHCVAVKGVA